MKKTITLLFMGLLLIETASALTVTLNVPSSFSAGDVIYFNYSITSDINQNVIFIPYTFCSHSMVRPLEQINTNLISNVPYNQVYFDTPVDVNFEPQICTASISIVSPVQQIFSKNFTINTNPSFVFDVVLNKKVFVNGEDIIIDYTSEVENPSIVSSLTYPDNKSIENIILPYSFRAKQIGTYNLEVIATKEGYKDVNIKEQFGVIEAEADIPYVGTGRGASGEEGEGLDSGYVLLVAAVAAVLAVVIVAFLFYRRGRKPGNVKSVGTQTS